VYERRRISSEIPEIKLPETDLYVVVNDFEPKTIKDFISNCQKVLRTGINFLPIVIDSYGGHVYTLLGMIDFLKNCGVKIVTVCEGKAMSAGAVLFAIGEERYIGQQSTVMVHEVGSWTWGKTTDMLNDVKEVERLNNIIFDILDKGSHQTKGYWQTLLDKNKRSDLYLTANQAKRHNLATHIGIPYVETSVEIKRTLEMS
jgi:ATP-dependent protease ClpP protease subunit